MKESILNGKNILVVDDEADVLDMVEEEIMMSCPTSKIDKASSFEAASKKLDTQTYDLVILDIMGVQGFDLLEQAVKSNFKVAMLTAHALTPGALKRSFKMRARAYLPKEKLGEIVPFLEDVLSYEYIPGWKRLLSKLGDFFEKTFQNYEAGNKFWIETKEKIKRMSY
jgi:DNA-binding NtrC family response regulator